MQLRIPKIFPVMLGFIPLLGCAASLGRSASSLELAPAVWPVDFAVLTRPTGIISEYNCPVYLTSKETGATLILRTEVRKVEQSTEIAFSQRRYSLFGDYQIDPTDALGISANQRVRIYCRTFQVLGIARPQDDDVLRKSQFR